MYLTKSGNLTFGKLNQQVTNNDAFFTSSTSPTSKHELKYENSSKLMLVKIEANIKHLSFEESIKEQAVTISEKSKNSNSINKHIGHPYKIKFDCLTDYSEFLNVMKELQSNANVYGDDIKEDEKENELINENKMKSCPFPVTIYDNKHSKYYYFLFCNPRNAKIYIETFNHLQQVNNSSNNNVSKKSSQETSFNLLVNEILSLGSSEISMFRLLRKNVNLYFFCFFLMCLQPRFLWSVFL